MNKEIMKALGFDKEVESFEQGRCPFCDVPVNAGMFKNSVSVAEYLISGMCQKCQDETFTYKGDEESA